MPGKLSEFYDTIRTSLTSGTFTATVLWGALATGLVAILEYNISAMDGGAIEIQYAMIVGGGVAGVLYAGSRDVAAKAGALAAVLPVLLLAPIAYLLLLASGTVGTATAWIAAATAFVLIVMLPAVLLVSALFGAIAAFVTHWLVEQIVGQRTVDSELTK